MKLKFQILLAALCGLLLAAPVRAADAAAAPVIDPEALRVLQAVSDQLTAAKAFSFQAEIWEDAVLFGHKVTTTRTVEAKVRRPDGLQMEVRSPKHSRGFWYDGKSLTLLDRVGNLYGTIAVPDTLDKVLDAAGDKFGITFPLEDVLVGNLDASVLPEIKGGAYFGKVTVLGTPCVHIAFSTDVVDWQLWITDDASPRIRKMTITYKREDTAPQFTALFTEWKLSGELSDATFAFTPPAGSAKIEVLPAADQE